MMTWRATFTWSPSHRKESGRSQKLVGLFTTKRREIWNITRVRRTSKTGAKSSGRSTWRRRRSTTRWSPTRTESSRYGRNMIYISSSYLIFGIVQSNRSSRPRPHFGVYLIVLELMFDCNLALSEFQVDFDYSLLNKGSRPFSGWPSSKMVAKLYN